MSNHNATNDSDSIDSEPCPRCGSPIHGQRCDNCGVPLYGPEAVDTVRCYECGSEVLEVDAEQLTVRTALGIPTSKWICDDCRPPSYQTVISR